MAVIHISEAEAVINFRSVLRQVDSGDHVIIDRPDSALELLASPVRGKTVAEALFILEQRGNRTSDDLKFADDLQTAIDSLRSLPTRSSPWD